MSKQLSLKDTITSVLGFMKPLLADIRFWILILFIIRMVGITNPPLETGHNWRQTTVAMVARNFLEVDNNILFPRIDIAGELSGITGMEFPLLNYLIYLLSEIFGYQHWYGRLINLVVSSLGLWFFFKLTRKYFEENVSFYSTIILGVSVWFQFSRKIMPDTFAVSLVIAGIYYGSNYLDGQEYKRRVLQLAGYIVLTILGALAKLPAAYLLVLFSLLIFSKSVPFTRKLILILTSFLILIPVWFWYYHWVPLLVEKYGFWHFFMGKSLPHGFAEILDDPGMVFKRFYDTALKFIGFAVFLIGLSYAVIRKERKLLAVFILTFVGFSVVMFASGNSFSKHDYYIIPFVPVMALVAGYGLSLIRQKRIAWIFLLVIAVEGIANQQHDLRGNSAKPGLLSLEEH
ncbi:MAG: glycosyltransferase family 39 protein, partial [Bacteroidales bacterium]|nr:glycosyltransferase family 39 protein [Bacteroidales bacterium]